MGADVGSGEGAFAGTCLGAGSDMDLATGKASAPIQPRDGDGGCFAAMDAGGGAISVDGRAEWAGGFWSGTGAGAGADAGAGAGAGADADAGW